MKSTNKKILKTKQALFNALCSIMASKNIEDITVSELCRKAHINRTTFYKYYSVPADILGEYANQIYEKISKVIHDKRNTFNENDIYNTMLNICYIYYEYKHIMKVYIEHNKYLIDAFQQIIKKNVKIGNAQNTNSLLTFISGGIAAIIWDWSIHDYKELPEDIAKTLTKYILTLQMASYNQVETK